MGDEDDLLVNVQTELRKLRSRITDLEQQLDEQRDAPLSSRTFGSETSEEIEVLQGLIEEARVAKAEALQYSRVGKNELSAKVRQLYGLLQQAKADREIQAQHTADLERRLSDALAAKEAVEKKAQLDRTAFAKIIKEDRERYGKKLLELQRENDRESGEDELT